MRRLIILFALIISFLLPITPVRADVAPPPPPQGANIAPDAEITQVRMVSEIVQVDIAQNQGDQPARARVTAQFQMRNLGSTAESMNVRFPLNMLSYSSTVDEKSCGFPDFFPAISDFSAEVEAKPVKVTTARLTLDTSWTGKPAKPVDCWASFPVTFQPEQETKIEVKYTIEGYYGLGTDGLVEFPYVLLTGANWKDTIDHAEVIFRAPMPLTAETFFTYQPDYLPGILTITGNEAHLNFSDFEPESNASITIVNPALWQRIVKDEAAVQKNPKDGEAWGRLGMFYKKATTLRRGFREDAGGEALYEKSKAAYRKCLALLPKDAEWHAGFAELLVWNFIFPAFGSQVQRRDELVEGMDHVRLALALDSNQVRAKQLVEDLDYWDEGRVPPGDILEIENGQPIFIALTLTPTALVEPTITPSPTKPPIETPLQPSPTAAQAQIEPTATNKPSTAIPVAQSATPEAATSAPTSTDSPAQISRPGGLCGTGFAPLALVAWMVLKKRLG